MLLYGAYGYLGHLRWHSIRHKPRAISATYGGAQYARVASLCARPSHGYAMQRPARIRSAFYLLILTFLQSFIVAPSQYTHPPPYGYRILKITVFLKKYTFICDSIYIYQIQYTFTEFNIHLPNSIYIIYITYRSIVRHSLSKFTPTFTIRFVPD